MIKVELLNLFTSIAASQEVIIISAEVMPDHVHLFVSAPPRLSPSDIVNVFKGMTARMLRMKFPELKKIYSEGLWTRRYHVGTAGNISAETIKAYIADQEALERAAQNTGDETTNATLTPKAGIGAIDDSTALLLGLLGFAATKLRHTALWHCKEQWESTGKSPSYQDVNRLLKGAENRWYRRPACLIGPGGAGRALGPLQIVVRAPQERRYHRPSPSFRRKTSLSTLTFKQDSVSWDPETETLRLGIPAGVYEKKCLRFHLSMNPGLVIPAQSVQMARVSEKDALWTVHLMCRIPKPASKDRRSHHERRPRTKPAAVDGLYRWRR